MGFSRALALALVIDPLLNLLYSFYHGNDKKEQACFASTAGAVSAQTIQDYLDAQKGVSYGKSNHDHQASLELPA